MKKIVLTFGLIAGAVLSVMMLITIPFQDQINVDHGYVIGYTTMVLAFLLIYFGVRSYRDNVAGGTVGFGRELAIGTLITAVASLCYVATWEVLYFNFEHDFLTKMQAHELGKARANGASEEAIAKKKVEMDKFAVMYDNPAYNAALTFLEPLPVGLVIALVTAGVLSRRKKGRAGDGDPMARAQAST
jgi:hypothetical protein